jgi:hypothetical protein
MLWPAKVPVIVVLVFCVSLVHSLAHVLDDEVEFDVLKRNFVKNLLADQRSAKQANKLATGPTIDSRIDDFKTSFNRELRRRKPLGASRRRRSIDENVKAGEC